MTSEAFMRRMLEAFPEATAGEDADGQLVVYTGLKESARDGVTVVVPISVRENTGEAALPLLRAAGFRYVQVGAVKRVDRIDRQGNIREHVLVEGDDGRTICGLLVEQSQAPAGNRPCVRCERLLVTREQRARTGEVVTHADGVEWAGALRKLVKLYALTRTEGFDAIGERLKQEATIFRSFEDLDSDGLDERDRKEYADAVLRLVELAKAFTGEDA